MQHNCARTVQAIQFPLLSGASEALSAELVHIVTIWLVTAEMLWG